MLDSVFPSYNRIGLTPRVSSDSNIPQNLQTCPKQFLNHPFVKKKRSEGSITNLWLKLIHKNRSFTIDTNWMKSNHHLVTSLRARPPNFPIIRWIIIMRLIIIRCYFAAVRHLSASFIRDSTRDDWPGNGREPSTSEITSKHIWVA